MRFAILIGAFAALLTPLAANAFDSPKTLVDAIYQPYIDGEKELWELNAEYRRGLVR